MDKTWKVVLVFAAIFFVGTACGALMGMRWSRTKPQVQSSSKVSSITLESFTRSQISTMAKRLKLTEEQRERVRPAIQKASEELAALRRKTYRETLDVMDRMNNEVDKVLTPEQSDNFTDMRIIQRDRMRTLMKGTPAKSLSDKAAPKGPAPGVPAGK